MEFEPPHVELTEAELFQHNRFSEERTSSSATGNCQKIGYTPSLVRDSRSGKARKCKAKLNQQRGKHSNERDTDSRERYQDLQKDRREERHERASEKDETKLRKDERAEKEEKLKGNIVVRRGD
jgi:putative hemolysin